MLASGGGPSDEEENSCSEEGKVSKEEEETCLYENSYCKMYMPPNVWKVPLPLTIIIDCSIS